MISFKLDFSSEFVVRRVFDFEFALNFEMDLQIYVHDLLFCLYFISLYYISIAGLD
jgi:hypothetical protein